MSADLPVSRSAWRDSLDLRSTEVHDSEYEDSLRYIHSLQRYGSLKGLERIEALLRTMGNPERSVRAVHVAGTNGKGSVTSMIASVLSENGLKTGMYISPYLESFEERIVIDGVPIPRDDLVRLTRFARGCIDAVVAEGYDHPTEFETVTAMAFKYFAVRGVDVVSLEVGLGGRYDATNVVQPLVSVITSIGLDHRDQLGDTIREIAGEKAGIIKRRGLVVSAAGSEEAQDVIRRVCREQGAFLVEVGRDVTWTSTSVSLEGQWFSLKGFLRSYEGLFVPLVGQHQLVNAAAAVTALELLKLRGIDVSEGVIREGLSRTRWPGRFEVLEGEPRVVLDCAHNPDGARALAATVSELLRGHKIILVLGVLRDKEVEGIVGRLVPMSARVITTEPVSPRAMRASELAEIVGSKMRDVAVEPSIPGALAQALSSAGMKDVVLVAGSIYLVGEARRILRKMGRCPGRAAPRE